MYKIGENISKSYGAKVLFEDIFFHINAGEKIGLIGENGVGKTSLIKIITGEDTRHGGVVNGHLPFRYVTQLLSKEESKSGGEQKRAEIDQAIRGKNEFLILDEPTTNLDMDNLTFFIQALNRHTGGHLLITHDRDVLEKTCDIIWELAPDGLHVFNGTLDELIEQKKIEQLEQQRKYDSYEQKKRQLEQAIEKKERQAKRASSRPKNLVSSEARASAATPYYNKLEKKLARVGKGMERRLEQMEQVDKPQEEQKIRIIPPAADNLKGRNVFSVTNLAIGFPGNKLLNGASFVIKGGEHIALVGENGSGKTTLIKEILSSDHPNISISPQAKIGYFSQTLAVLDETKTLQAHIMEHTPYDEALVRALLMRLKLTSEEYFLPISALSGGQKVKFSLAQVILSDANVLVLDEPTNFLDIDSMEGLEYLLREYEGTILFVSHDRHFVENIATRLLVIEDKKINSYDSFAQQLNMQKVKNSGNAHADLKAEQMKLDVEISALIGELSISPSTEKEKKLDAAIKRKQELVQLLAKSK